MVLGLNVKVGPFCIIRSGAKIGNNCKFTAYCKIRENVVIGEGTTMGSRCTISANATIGKNTKIKFGFVLKDTPNLKEESGTEEISVIFFSIQKQETMKNLTLSVF